VPQHVVVKLHAEVQKALRRADVEKELTSQGASPTLDKGPEDLAAYLKSQTDKLDKLVKLLDTKT
jgi:tripartite-type tricarboxylate transporter receptor subunit TctC